MDVFLGEARGVTLFPCGGFVVAVEILRGIFFHYFVDIIPLITEAKRRPFAIFTAILYFLYASCFKNPP